jgi:hypothetical protein
MDHTVHTHTEADGYVVPVVDPRLHTDVPDEPGAFAGRPADDRALEIVEGGIGAAAGLALGTTVAGPVGAAIGIAVGAAAGFIVGEIVERRMGRVTTTTNAEPNEDTLTH